MHSGLAILLIGFFLGMRHATDPDHVIAVSTIVSRERSGARAAMIGAFWGLGHTITIVLVGAAIILFNVVIPPRAGLSIPLAVALTRLRRQFFRRISSRLFKSRHGESRNSWNELWGASKGVPRSRSPVARMRDDKRYSNHS